ncbi:BTAD domain-containing putative transcriptional regulator [Streptomyces sp. BE303]|uniref:BTAD domain-containing putative transcriptional regulator n=1 Tax=Streptomyces sp. BE303 TaxID=3002528 RepID=UPI002E789DC6|nr:BTAD domain-containing putative transcriptional regulator [Streptomyces sp. BE303]MED7955236.1 BTAD domain-containing putative transcriptional regulator [Streptomyces sp. BE303]
MVQNSVAGLRRTFQAVGDPAGGNVALNTIVPGYTLRIEPEQLDLTEFHELVTLGRARLAAGEWAGASGLLRRALGLWRGPVLADVTDAGLTWPELAALQGTRLAVHEDCIQAELAMGRDRELIGELETLLEAEPTRERLVAQLMVVLYNCGRQPEALDRYRRTRDLLADRFGLEPGRDLRRLQRAILSHDPALALRLTGGPGGGGPAGAAPSPGGALAAVPHPAPDPDGHRTPAAAPVQRRPRPAASAPSPPAAPETPGAHATPEPADGEAAPVAEHAYRPSWERVERRRASVVMVRARWTADGGAVAPERIDHATKELTAVIRRETAPFGGLVRRAFGSVWLVVFGVPRAHEDDAERALRAALALRRHFASPEPAPGSAPAGSGPRPAAGSASGPAPGGARLVTHLVVGSGEVVVTYDDSATEPVEVTGEVLDACHHLLLQVPRGELWACAATVEAGGALLGFTPVDGTPGVHRLATESPPAPGAPGHPAEPPFLERTHELNLLRGAYQDTVRRQLPHLITVLGEPGIGKTRLIGEFAAGLRAEAGEDAPRVLYAGTPAFDAHTSYEPLAGVVRAYAGIRPGAPAAVVVPALTAVVRGLFPHAVAGRIVTALAACLGLPAPASSPEGPGGGTVPREEVLGALRQLIEEAAAERPLVVVLDDLHRAAGFVRSFVEDLTVRLGPVALLLVAGARSELLHTTPSWGCAKRRSALMHVAPLSTTATGTIIGAASGRRRPSPADDRRAALADGNPLFAQAYARAEAVGGDPAVAHPPAVLAIAAAQLDDLDRTARSVLRDAAVVGGTLWRGAVAAVSLRDTEEVGRGLDSLESRELLRRVRRSSVPGDVEYVFRYAVSRDVALAQLPGRVLVERHLRAASWAALLDVPRPALLAFHYDRAVALTEADGAPVEAMERRAWEALVGASARAAAAGDDALAVSCLGLALDRCPPGEPERVWLATHHRRILDSLGEPASPARPARAHRALPAARR